MADFSVPIVARFTSQVADKRAEQPEGEEPTEGAPAPFSKICINSPVLRRDDDVFAADFPPFGQPGEFPEGEEKIMFNHVSRTLLWASALIGLAQGLQAAEEVTLIDQKAALSGKVTPLDTPGFPVTISQSGSYRLAGNLDVPDAATTAIQITADNVTLDLNGFTISGPNVCTPSPTHCTYSGGSGIGIMAVGPPGVVSPANVRVMNGVVRGMGGHGIRMMGDGTLVQSVVSVSNGGPGIVVGEGSVIDSVAKLNESGAAIVGLIVRGCTAANNAFGIFVRPGGVASGNVAVSNGATGITVNDGTATGNTAYNNGTYGIDAVCPGALIGNTASNNASGNSRTTGTCTLANNSF